MFKFSRASKAKPDSQFAETTMVTAGESTVAAGGFQRDLIYVSFKDTLRVYGVPAEWLDCLVITYPDREGNERVQIQLVMRKWSGHLMRYAMALEHQLVQCLDRYEPHVDHSEYEWVWRYGDDCDCPFPDLPAPAEWAQKKVANNVRGTVAPAQPKPMPPVAAKAPPPADDKDFDLRDIFSDLKPEDLRKR